MGGDKEFMSGYGYGRCDAIPNISDPATGKLSIIKHKNIRYISASMQAVSVCADTLFEILRLERGRTDLQELPPMFQQEADSYILQEKASVAQASSETDRKKKELSIQNCMKILEEIHDRRLKKITALALNKARTPSALIDYQRFLPAEKGLFETLLKLFSEYKKEKIEALPAQAHDHSPPIAIHEMRGKPVVNDQAVRKEEDKKVPQTIIHKNVKFLSPMPSFYGPELEKYGPFFKDDCANLPAQVADILIRKNRAQPM